MPTYTHRPTEVEAIQFLPQKHHPWVSCSQGEFYVIAIHGQKTVVVEYDWIVKEPDGIHHYPIKPDIFEQTYFTYVDLPPARVNCEGVAAPPASSWCYRPGKVFDWAAWGATARTVRKSACGP